MSVYTDSPSTFVRNGIKPRLSQVYVEIPPSPFIARLHRKENASSKVSAALSLSKMTSLKRKVEDIHDSSSKKLKHSKTAAVDSAKTNAPCHHCRKRKPLTGIFALSFAMNWFLFNCKSDILQCTRLKKGGSRCRTSYCDICLNERCVLFRSGSVPALTFCKDIV